jgi:transcriptional coactivator HFI1/ADA1
MQASAPPPANAHASSSTGHLGAPYHPTLQRVEPLPSFQRVDINAIKQELHDVLGDRGLPYWKALNGYLLGQIGRDEMISMVTRWLKGSQGMFPVRYVVKIDQVVDLHNRLLQALLYNASAPTLTTQSPALSNLRKRRRLGTDDPEFDTDDTRIEPKARVHSWVMGLTGKERMRVRRAVIGRGQDEDGEEGDEGDGKKKKSISFAPSKSLAPWTWSSTDFQPLVCLLSHCRTGHYRPLINYRSDYLSSLKHTT